MTRKLTTADLLFMQAQILFGSTPPIGTDPFSLQGIRSVDGDGNNISYQDLIDQYGDPRNTSMFGRTNQPFIFYVDPVYMNAPGGAFTNPQFGPTLWEDNYAPGAYVMDASPRIISNLVADMNPVTNPYVPDTAFGNPGSDVVFATPFNSLMTIFGQFFDHGLSFIAKGGAGSVYIPLLPTDVNYNPAPGPDFIPLTRASIYIQNIDGSMVTNTDGSLRQLVRNPADTDPKSTNLWYQDAGGANPTAYIQYDKVLGAAAGQKLTYLNTTSPLVDQNQTYGSSPAMTFFLQEVDANGALTGRLVTGADGGMATWADIKANAAKRGITLTDADVFNAPEVTLNTLTLNPNDYVRTGKVTNQMFLADIANSADPSGGKTADADGVIGLAAGSNVYDNELLDAHYVAGDPRVNENVALTAVHSVFHGEHNRLVLEIKDLILQQDQIQPGFAAQWNNEQIFQAAKLANEMQYQHMVFEEFARRVSPNIDAFSIYNVNLNPNITSEFANAVYRLGHSMLTDKVDMVNAADQKTSVTLVEAFLSPLLFKEIGAADINKGMSQQTGNEIDEFVADSVRNMLLGLPLDLAAINIARARETGVPSLNAVRTELFAQTSLLQLKPYESWEDFGANLLNPTSLVNFIAAYSTDAAITAARNAGNYNTPGTGARALAEAKLNDTAFMNGGDQGFQSVDLWLGGLAEAKVLPGGVSPGMLGSTFDFIFATQMLALQNGDRLYYLARIGGNLLDQIEQQTFVDMLARSGNGTHINGDTFGTADAYIELSNRPNGVNENLTKTPAAAAAVYHEVIGGTHNANTVNAGDGNDTVWGEGGNDVIEGGRGKDKLYGGDGNDTITDIDGDELIRGGRGNDTINAGLGIDVVFGEEGNDTIRLGLGDDESFGGLGNDVIYGDDGVDALTGDEGDDILDGGVGDDALAGLDGNDILIGGAGIDLITGGVGNDFLIGGANADTLDGGLGLGEYDVVSYENVFATGTGTGLTIDMQGLVLGTGDAQGDVFIDIEEVRGTNRNDTMFGDALANVLVGKGGNDSLDGRDGDDTLLGGVGNDTLTGGLGIDTAVFDDVRANYVFNGITVTHTPTGEVDFLSGIEVLEFADQSITTASLQNLPFINFANSTPHLWNLGSNPIAGVVGVQQSLPLVDATVRLVDGTALADYAATTGINLGAISVFPPLAPIGVRTFALAGTDALSFQIVTVGGVPQLHFIGAGPLSKVNYEAKQEYNVTISVTDAIGSTSLNIIVKVDDVNDNAPVVSTGESFNVQENTLGGDSTLLSAGGTVIYRAQAEDRDANDTFTFAMSGADAAQFQFLNGELRFKNSPNYENPTDANGDNIYEIGITANDGVNTSAVKQIKIKVTDVAEGANAPPSITNPVPPNPIPVNENTLASTVVFDGQATDPEGDQLIWSIVDTVGAPAGHVGDAGYFTIDANGDVRFLNSPDFENPLHASPDYYITVQVRDPSHGTPVTQDIRIQVLNIAESVAIEAGTTAFNWAENQAAATVIRDFNTTVAAGGVVWSVLGQDAARFGIDTNGNLRFLASKNFEAPDDVGNDGIYNVTVRATDSTTAFAEQAITVTLTNVNEAPSITSTPPATPILVAENTDPATVIYDVEATDPDAGTILSVWTLGGVDAGLFSVNSVGQIRFNSAPDFESPADVGANNVYNITVTVSDGALSSATQAITISVTNVNGVTLTGDQFPLVVPTADSLVGTNEDDVISGLALADVLTGLGGNDNIDGGTGIDQMIGGAGSDTYAVDETLDVVTEAAGQGTDTVNSTATYTLSANVENLNLLGALAINGTGNALANIIVGNGADNVIQGLGGADTLNGGAGNDTLSYALSAAGVIVNIATNAASGGDAQGDTISNFEHITGSAFADTLTGNGVANIIDGGAGIDTMAGGAANDTYFVDNTLDVVTEAAGGGTADVVNSTAASYTLAVNVENLNLLGAGNINGTGNAVVNVIVGNTGNNIIEGGAGGDTLNGGDGVDTVSYVTSNAAVNVNLATNVVSGGHAAGDVISNFENVTGSGFNDTLTGSAGNNVIAGGVGNDTINAAGGTSDTVVFNGLRSQFVISGTTTLTVNGTAAGQGTDTVTNAEFLRFNDTTLAVLAGGTLVDVGTFDGLAYIASYPDLIAAFGPAFTAEEGTAHYTTLGSAEGRRVMFNGQDYINSNADLLQAFGYNPTAGTLHFLENGFQEGRPVIDGRAYVASYQDLINAFSSGGITAAEGIGHYQGLGLAEGRHVIFKGMDYINSNLDLRIAFGNNATAGVDHYLSSGNANGENRGIVDGLAYIASYDDLMTAFGTNAAAGVGHYTASGSLEGRSITFDASTYVAKYADLRAAYGSDLQAATSHYIQWGRAEGRTDDNSGIDALTGSAQTDLLIGGLGSDSMDGAGGADYYRFDAALGPSNVDTIVTFVVAEDTIQLENDIFTALAPGGVIAADAFLANTTGLAAGVEDRIIFNSTTGALFYDADGTGAGAGVQFATISLPGLVGVLSNNDFQVV